MRKNAYLICRILGHKLKSELRGSSEAYYRHVYCVRCAESLDIKVEVEDD